MLVENMLVEAYNLSSFRSLEALDSVVNKFKMIADKYIYRGKKSFMAVVEHLRRYSCVAKGVSFCKVSTMAGLLKLSERTIQRIINRLVDLGLVKKHEAFDAKTGTQLPNYYQLQSKVDWVKVDDALSPQIMIAYEGELVDSSTLSDTHHVTQDDTPNVTPYSSVEPSQDKPFWALPDKGSFLYSFKSFKKDNEYNKSFPFYNWLEENKEEAPEKTVHKQIEKSIERPFMQLPEYLSR